MTEAITVAGSARLVFFSIPKLSATLFLPAHTRFETERCCPATKSLSPAFLVHTTSVQSPVVNKGYCLRVESLKYLRGRAPTVLCQSAWLTKHPSDTLTFRACDKQRLRDLPASCITQSHWNPFNVHAYTFMYNMHSQYRTTQTHLMTSKSVCTICMHMYTQISALTWTW